MVKVLKDSNQEVRAIFIETKNNSFSQFCQVPEAMNDFDLCIKKKEHKLYGAFGPKEHLGPMKKATKITFD